MTAKKNFKRLVRARARKTGESYAAALWHFQREAAEEQAMVDPAPTLPTLRRIEKPEYGFALSLPEDWKEEPPDPRNSAWEVARFRGTEPALKGHHRNCLVFRNPAHPGMDARAAARNNQPPLERGGFGNFRYRDAVVAGQPAVQLECEQRDAGRVWATRSLFTKVDGVHLILHLGTAMPERDGALFDDFVSSLRLLDG